MDSQKVSYKKICVNLHAADFEAIKAEAQAQDRDVAWVIRNVIRTHVHGEESA